MKSTVEQIRERFDRDVERFSRLETGQSATMDAPLVLDLIAQRHPQVAGRKTAAKRVLALAAKAIS